MRKKAMVFGVCLSIFLMFGGAGTSWADGPSQLLVVRAENNTLWKATCENGTECSEWEQISGTFTQQPTLVWDTDIQRYYLYGVGEDGRIWRSSFNRAGNFFNDWTPLSGATPSPIAAAAGNIFLTFDYEQTTDDYSLTGTTVHNVLVRTITCPFDGYVVATGAGSIWYGPNAASVQDGVRVSLANESGTIGNYRQVSRQRGDSAGDETIYPFSYQRVFTVSEGQNFTVYLTAMKEWDTATSVEILNPTMTLKFHPYRN